MHVLTDLDEKLLLSQYVFIDLLSILWGASKRRRRYFHYNDEHALLSSFYSSTSSVPFSLSESLSEFIVNFFI